MTLRSIHRGYGHGLDEGGSRDWVGGGDRTSVEETVFARRPVHHDRCAPGVCRFLTAESTITMPLCGFAAASVTSRPPKSPPRTLDARCATLCHRGQHRAHIEARTGSHFDRAQPSTDRPLIRASTYGCARDEKSVLRETSTRESVGPKSKPQATCRTQYSGFVKLSWPADCGRLRPDFGRDSCTAAGMSVRIGCVSHSGKCSTTIAATIAPQLVTRPRSRLGIPQ